MSANAEVLERLLEAGTIDVRWGRLCGTPQRRCRRISTGTVSTP